MKPEIDLNVTHGCAVSFRKAFAPLPVAGSRTVKLGGTVATVGFPDIGLQGFAPKVLAHGHHGGNRVAGGRGG